jgi:hypothetical protein
MHILRYISDIGLAGPENVHEYLSVDIRVFDRDLVYKYPEEHGDFQYRQSNVWVAVKLA